MVGKWLMTEVVAYTGPNTRESIRWVLGHACAPVRGLQQKGNHVEQPPLQHPTTKGST